MGRVTMEGDERDTALLLAVREIEALKREIKDLRSTLERYRKEKYYQFHLDHVLKSAEKGEQE